MHNLATVENRTALASLAVRLKQISVAWMISILTVCVSLLRCPQSELYLDSAALGITDEVEKLGLKGSKKRRGKQLDEDYMVLSHALILHPVSNHRHFLTARTQTSGREGYSKGRTGSPADAEQESAFQAPYSNKGASSISNAGASADLVYAKITENDAALRQIMRLRGFSLMTNILQDYAKDLEVTILVRFPSSLGFV